MRTLSVSHRILVASPQLASQFGTDIAALKSVPTLGTRDEPGEIEWCLETENHPSFQFRHEARMSCSDFIVIREAAIRGLGIAFLPDNICRNALENGELVQPFPLWRSEAGIVHLLFTTRRGLPPAVRALIACLAVSISVGQIRPDAEQGSGCRPLRINLPTVADGIP